MAPGNDVVDVGAFRPLVDATPVEAFIPAVRSGRFEDARIVKQKLWFYIRSQDFVAAKQMPVEQMWEWFNSEFPERAHGSCQACVDGPGPAGDEVCQACFGRQFSVREIELSGTLPVFVENASSN